MPTELESQFSDLIGQRVSIRLHEAQGGFRDILGHLLTPYSLRNKRGEVIEFSHSEIFVWKKVIEKQ
jgi:N-acetylglutamate synthase